MPNRPVQEKILVMVICVDGVPRNSDLKVTLASNPGTFEVVYVNAIQPSDITPNELQKLKTNSEYLIGRPVTSIEAVVMLSHRRCYEILVSTKKAIGIIIEDDVDLALANLDYTQMSELLCHDQLRIVTLAKSKWSCWIKKNEILKARFPPPCAACYLINRSTAQYALSFKPMGLADWPQWAHKVDFFHLPMFEVPIDTTDSYIEATRSEFLAMHRKLLIFTKVPKGSGIKKIWQFRSIIWYRTIWKFYHYVNLLRISSRKKSIKSE